MTISPTRDLVVDLTGRPDDVEDALATVRDADALEPFADEIVAFCADFSRRLSKASRSIPELTALAFWMRKAELVRLRGEFAQLATPETLLMPRGTVLHIPPANVDTIFIYSWLLSALLGNKNVIRLSSRQTPNVELILSVLADTLADQAHTRLGDQTTFVRYGHDDSVTARLSAVCDVRVIWGGDGTIQTIRKAPLPPHSVELTFPDRFSMAVMDVETYLARPAAARDELAEAFFNDAYWFDQMGCSSPRILYWIGARQHSTEASADFYPRVRSVVTRRGYAVDTAIAIRKMTFAYQAVLDHPVRRVETFGNELKILKLEGVDSVHGDFAGAGTFFDVTLERLADLAPLINRRDQTLSHFGFDATELRALAVEINGAGLDRMVPFGQALTFNRFWDGHDLLQAFSRRVFISAGTGAFL